MTGVRLFHTKQITAASDIPPVGPCHQDDCSHYLLHKVIGVKMCHTALSWCYLYVKGCTSFSMLDPGPRLLSDMICVVRGSYVSLKSMRPRVSSRSKLPSFFAQFEHSSLLVSESTRRFSQMQLQKNILSIYWNLLSARPLPLGR